MNLLYECPVPEPQNFYIRDDDAGIVSWHGRKALRLSGEGASLLLHPDLLLPRGRIQVDIGSEGRGFPGIVFRAADTHNYELAYAQPHTSGKWDALQYDPVFHGSNTWQLYFGGSAQKTAEVPAGKWFTLRVEFHDRRALIQVGEQEPLLVQPLAHDRATGRIGLWTFRPAYFSNLRVWEEAPGLSSVDVHSPQAAPASGTIVEWFLEGFGAVRCEPNGILNLNRYLPNSVREVRLVRKLEMTAEGTLTFRIGFSDDLSLQVDDRVIFTGRHTWKESSEWADRGYVSMDQQAECALSQGVHTITAVVKATEDFGYGMALQIEGCPHRLLPADLFG